jgi:hypothetical protein
MMLEQAYGAASRQAADQQRQFIQGMGSDLLGAGVGLAGNEFAYSQDPFGMGANKAARAKNRLSRKIYNVDVTAPLNTLDYNQASV